MDASSSIDLFDLQPFGQLQAPRLRPRDKYCRPAEASCPSWRAGQLWPDGKLAAHKPSSRRKRATRRHIKDSSMMDFRLSKGSLALEQRA